jgi:hypothetical protein
LPVPVAARTTVAPWIGLLKASLAVTVIVEALDPLLALIDVGEAETADWAADTPAAVTVTLAVWVIPTPLMVAETTFAAAPVELRVPVATPLEFVVPLG